MPSGTPWSVKGIDPRARAIAKTAARREGVTLGEWLNRVILDDGPEAGTADWEERLSGYPGFGSGGGDGDGEDQDALRGVIKRLTDRLEAAEHRSTLALTGVDQSVVALSRRLEALEETREADEGEIEEALARTRARHEELLERLRRLERAGPAGGTDPSALKAVETTVGKLAGRLFETEREVRAELDNLAHKDERRRDGAERAAKALGARLDETESRLREDQKALRDQVEAQTQRAGDTLRSVEDIARRLQSRIVAAENATHSAAEALAGSQQALDARLRELEARQGASVGADEINRRFEVLGRELAAIIRETREDCARQIASLDGSGGSARLERALEAAEGRLSAAEARQSDALNRIAHEVARVSRAVDRRIEAAEQRLEHRMSETERARRSREDQTGLEFRLDTVRAENTAAVRRIGEEVARLGETLSERVQRAEERSARAVEAAGERMAQVVERIEQARGREPEADLDARIRASEERTAERITKAMDGVYQRLDQARTETADVLSPVQRAMSALADRLEAIERRGAVTSEVGSAPVRKRGGGGGDNGGDEPGDDRVRPARTAALDRFETAAATIDFDAPLPQAPGLRDDALEEDGFDIAAGEPDEAAGPDYGAGEYGEPVWTERAPHTAQPAPVRTEAPQRAARLGATADADFLAAARKTVRANRSTSADWTPAAEPGSGRSRVMLVAASVLGFAAVAAAAGMLMLDALRGGEPASTAAADPSATLSTLFADASGADTGAAASAPALPSEVAPAVAGNDLDGAGGAAAEPSVPAPALPEPAPVERADPVPAQTDARAETAAQQPAPEPAEPITLERAAAEGDPVARYQLAVERLDAGALSDGTALMRRAAEQGVPEAMRRYAGLLQRGQGVTADPEAARLWMVRAAEAGNVLAMFEAGGLFIAAEDTPDHQAAAARWFQEAALHGNRDSQFNIALLFQEGFGVPQSPADAYAWLRIAANAGDEDAGARAASLRRDLSPEQRAAADAVAESFTPRPADPRAQGRYPRQPWQAAG
jgi:localization factor PodJL